MTHSPFHTVSSEVVFETPWLRVRHDVVERPDGSRGSYGYVDIPYPVAMVAAIDDDRRICLVRQWRHPWGRDSWELPAGRCEAGETPLEGARRELMEETGVVAGEWRHLATFYVSASIATEFHLYRAGALRQGEIAHDHEEQDMIATWVPLNDAIEAALDGRIVHGASIAALLRLACEDRHAAPPASSALHA